LSATSLFLNRRFHRRLDNLPRGSATKPHAYRFSIYWKHDFEYDECAEATIRHSDREGEVTWNELRRRIDA
jgi:hypothetical protein